MNRTLIPALLTLLTLSTACESAPPPPTATREASPTSAKAPLAIKLTRTPTSYLLEGSGPVALSAEARARVLEVSRLTRIVLQVETTGALADKGSVGLAKLMDAGLALDTGVIEVAQRRVRVEGRARNQADLETFETLLAEGVSSLSLDGSTIEVEIDKTSLREDEGFVKRVGGAPFVGTLEPISGGPALEVDSEGRAPVGVYRTGPDGLHLAVSAGQTTWVRDRAPSILIGGKRFALDTDVKVVLPGEEGALGFVTQEGDDGGPFVDAIGPDKMPLSGPRFEKPGDKLLMSELLAKRDFIRHVVLHADTAEDSAAGVRGLVKASRSSHFTIDWDGTIHQLLDVANCAFHAGEMNMRSVGIDLNNLMPNLERTPNASPWPKRHPRLNEMTSPEYQRPVSALLQINSAWAKSYGYTDAQYRALGALLRTLATVFPAIDEGPPRGSDGLVPRRVVDDPVGTRGVLAHWHVEMDRWDPGPAFDWKELGLDTVPRP